MPVILAEYPQDDGAACLAMALVYYGKTVSQDELRDQVVFAGESAANALAMTRAAETHGLRARGIRIDVTLEHLRSLAPGDILHLQQNMFVVFESLDADALNIVDPFVGSRRMPLDEARAELSGIVLAFEPGPMFRQDLPGARLVIPGARERPN